MEAHPTQTVAAWCEFCSHLPGEPMSIVADEDLAIRGAIVARWGVDFWKER